MNGLKVYVRCLQKVVFKNDYSFIGNIEIKMKNLIRTILYKLNTVNISLKGNYYVYCDI